MGGLVAMTRRGSSDEPWRLGFQPALQGLRAISVLAVFAFHVGAARGGWLGVEVFFVLSGFLITLLLLGEAHGSGIRLSRFYWRRVARLLPAAWVMMLAAVATAIVLDLAAFDMGLAALAASGYFANWAEVWGWDMQGLGHMWSLSIEEQFYFAWPLVMLAVGRRWGSAGVVWAAGMGAGATLVVRSVLTFGDDWYSLVYYGSATRAGGLLIGCLGGALLMRSRGTMAGRIPNWLGLAALAFVLACMAFLPIREVQTWRYFVTLVDGATVVVLLWLVNRTHVASRLLSTRLPVYLGEISYSLYLWHAPVIWAASRSIAEPAPRYAVQILLPFMLAAISYHWVEIPMRRLLTTRSEARLPAVLPVARR